MHPPAPFACLAIVVIVAGCGGNEASAGGERGGVACDAAAARAVVERFGERLRRVSLLAPDAVRTREIREAYADLVTPVLLEAWLADPSRAPGRETSSPWPDRIEVRSIAPADGDACVVEGAVVHVTSGEVAAGGAELREPVTLRVVEEDGWRIAAYQVGADDGGAGTTTTTATSATSPIDTILPADTTPADAAEVIRRYYRYIAAGDHALAYALWGDGGRASGKTLEDFAAGFAETASVAAEVGEPGRVEGAAGSRYVVVPVTVHARLRDGTTQRFEGTYTLRRSVVDGATAEQRSWRIHSAEVREVG